MAQNAHNVTPLLAMEVFNCLIAPIASSWFSSSLKVRLCTSFAMTSLPSLPPCVWPTQR